MGTVVFDPTAFLTRFPEFSSVNAALLGEYFTEATLTVDPTDASLVRDQNQRSVLLNLLTAHIAALEQGTGEGPSGLVGRVSSATQGSVSVSADYGAVSQSQAWYVQTPYGAKYWALTAQYRTMHYIPGACYGSTRRG